MTSRFTGKTALIAGAAGGQGRAGALLFARAGANLAITDVDEEGLTETAELVAKQNPETTVLARRVDLLQIGEIADFCAEVTSRFGAIDVLYNNAGVNHVRSIADTTEEEWNRVFGINLKASFFLVKYALPGLKAAESASVINVSSGAAWLAPEDGNGVYCGSKGGLNLLTRAQARDLAPYGIRVNCLLPGPIETPMVQGFFAAMPPDRREEVQAKVLSRSLFKRFGRPEEVAAVALFLASPEASYLTGAAIPVDAGWTSV